MPMFPAGRRWFITASWATVVVSLMHTAGNLLGGPPPDAAYTTLESTMKGYVVPLGLGMTPSMWDITQSLVFTMSICLATIDLLGVVVGTSRDTSARLLRPAALLLTLESAAMTILSYVYHVLPAFISMGVVTLLCLAALVESRQADSRVWR